MLLALRGQSVAAFADGEHAWRAYQREPFSLVLLDWLLPGIDGLELCRRIRATPAGGASFIVVITGRNRPQDLAAILEAGANDYLAKPFDTSSFQVRLTIAEQWARNIVDQKRAALLEVDRNQVLEQIARNEPLGDVLSQLALLVERQRPGSRCSVMLAAEGRLRTVAAPNLPEGYLQRIEELPIEPLAASCGTAAYRRDTVVTTDIATDLLWERYSQTALAHNLRACWSAPIFSAQGKVIGSFGMYHQQPSEPSESDLELLATASRLAAIAVEHARLFDEAAAADALRALDRLKSEFLSVVSHELRTPLSLVYGYAELLIQRAARLSTGDVVDMAREIHAGSRTMIRLVDDLLDFSRIEQGQLQLDRRTISVTQLLSGLVETFKHQPTGQRILAELPERLEASLDPERLSQIVGNLLSNALRYAPRGAIVLRAAARKGWLHVEVVDQGPGIPADEQAHVWEKFFRGASAMNSTTRGSGLGLAVVRHLVELQGGRVGLRSAPGQGSTFWLTVPAEARAGGSSFEFEVPSAQVRAQRSKLGVRSSK